MLSAHGIEELSNYIGVYHLSSNPFIPTSWIKQLIWIVFSDLW
jgi:hypothetical protein